jgi:hypothetical protein
MGPRKRGVYNNNCGKAVIYRAVGSLGATIWIKNRGGEFNRFAWVKKLRKSKGVIGDQKFGSNLGPDSAEHPLKPWYTTQNHAKRFNELDYRTASGPTVVSAGSIIYRRIWVSLSPLANRQ